MKDTITDIERHVWNYLGMDDPAEVEQFFAHLQSLMRNYGTIRVLRSEDGRMTLEGATLLRET